MKPAQGYGTVPEARGPVRAGLERRVTAGTLRADPLQRQLATRLDRLEAELKDAALTSKQSALGWLFGRRETRPSPKGLYIFGGVGRGKSMLMDLFFEASRAGGPKRRVHFHAFMGDVQDRIGRHRQAVKAGTASGDDPIPPVAAEIASEAKLLCFDEFSVTDIADAMILSRLFDALFTEGVVLVATSNVAPDDLYRDGLNRALFLPFVATLKNHCDVFELDTPTDYRLASIGEENIYLTPLGPETAARMDRVWAALLAGAPAAPASLSLKGRTLVVPAAGNGAARFAYGELLGGPLGAQDYLALAQRFHTIVLDGVPRLDPSQRNEAKRLILLVDTLYDGGRRLVMSAEVPAEALYAGRSGTEAFEFARTVSRLIEMRSAAYLAAEPKSKHTS